MYGSFPKQGDPKYRPRNIMVLIMGPPYVEVVVFSRMALECVAAMHEHHGTVADRYVSSDPDSVAAGISAPMPSVFWVVVKELSLTYYVAETPSFSVYVYTHHVNLVSVPEQQPSIRHQHTVSCIKTRDGVVRRFSVDSYQKSFEKRSLDREAEALPTICMHTMYVMVIMVVMVVLVVMVMNIIVVIMVIMVIM